MELNISIAPEILFYIKSFPVSNSFLWTLFISGFLTVATLIMRFSLKIIPGTLQNCVEILIEESFSFVKSVIRSEEKAKRVFPLFCHHQERNQRDQLLVGFNSRNQPGLPGKN